MLAPSMRPIGSPVQGGPMPQPGFPQHAPISWFGPGGFGRIAAPQETMVPHGVGAAEGLNPQQPSLMHILMAAAAAHPQRGANVPAQARQYPQFRVAPGIARAAGL